MELVCNELPSDGTSGNELPESLELAVMSYQSDGSDVVRYFDGI